ncbi:uncharacterized protein EI97DRAFT_180204 [Westerdykella ornata]|uniref:Uncharacterized protein n=1 Tax=Westerdykella ornata TaxID=318751 RepID=A0A6A6JTI0_WESOR|nr:uncharacterized protein EI97DRAFT_180204 [Westerdykella ornata]KAF2279565.1 hypothetical protein EI97DRAFT_180204 [Westerdykella ornata]
MKKEEHRVINTSHSHDSLLLLLASCMLLLASYTYDSNVVKGEELAEMSPLVKGKRFADRIGTNGCAIFGSACAVNRTWGRKSCPRVQYKNPGPLTLQPLKCSFQVHQRGDGVVTKWSTHDLPLRV